MVFPQNAPLNERIFNGVKYQFLVLSRADIKFFTSEMPYFVISIIDPENPDAEIADSEKLQAILRMKFHDVGKPPRQFGTETLSTPADISMTDADARQILSFVSEHLSQVKLIVCHCEQGISRSAAIAAALSHILQGEDEFFFRHFWVNRWVYELLVTNADFLKTTKVLT